MSIAEVEHNLLRCVDTDTPPSTLHITPLYPPRKIALHLEPTPAPPPAHSAAMSRPSTVLTKIPAPTTQFPGLALTQRDFRLNFCINNGSLSMLPYVPVYDVDRLDAQLDDMTSRLLEDAVEIDMNKRIVVLPKVPTHALDAGPGLLLLYLMRPTHLPLCQVCCWYLADFATRRIGAVATSPGADRGAQVRASHSSDGMCSSRTELSFSPPIRAPPPPSLCAAGARRLPPRPRALLQTRRKRKNRPLAARFHATKREVPSPELPLPCVDGGGRSGAELGQVPVGVNLGTSRRTAPPVLHIRRAAQAPEFLNTRPPFSCRPKEPQFVDVLFVGKIKTEKKEPRLLERVTRQRTARWQGLEVMACLEHEYLALSRRQCGVGGRVARGERTKHALPPRAVGRRDLRLGRYRRK